MTISELGRKVKAKYPEYAHLSDEEAGRRLVVQYPDYRSYVDGMSSDIEKQIEQIRSGQASGWKIINNVRSKRAASKAELVAQQNAIAAQIIESERRIAEARTIKVTSELADEEARILAAARKAETNLQIAISESSTTFVTEAAKEGLTLENSQGLKVQKEMLNLRKDEKAFDADLDVDKDRRLKQTEREHKEEMDRIVLDTLREETRVKIEAAFFFQLAPVQQLAMLRLNVQQLYIEAEETRERLSAGTPAQQRANDRLLKLIEDDITALEKEIKGRRLLLPHVGGQKAKGLDEDADGKNDGGAGEGDPDDREYSEETVDGA